MFRAGAIIFLASVSLLAGTAEFDRVERAGVPNLRDALSCVQAEAALLPLAKPEEVRGIHFRKGYCTLAAATVTGDSAAFEEAASEFDKAGTPTVSAIVRRQILPATPVNLPSCPDALVPVPFCEGLKSAVHLWLGQDALRKSDLAEAARQFSSAAVNFGWSELVAGRRAFEQRRYPESVAQYRSAVDLARRAPVPSPERLGPRVDISSTLTDLGGAQLAAGDRAAAIVTLDEAGKAAPASARPVYLRARAREASGQTEAALNDYNLAGRLAFAGAVDLASGEAHLYRGMALYLRKDYPRSENEFASALNFEITPGLRSEATAWRHLAAVASGSCGASRDLLARSLPSVSPFFPVADARSRIAACATVLDKMANRSVNKVTLLGHLGKDAETKFTPSGISVSKFSLATNRRSKDSQTGEWKDITDWHNIVMWRTESIANFLLKGKQVYLEGRLENRSWEDKEGQKRYITEVICEGANVVLLGGGGRGGDSPSEPSGDYDRPVSMPRSAQQRQQPAAQSAPADDFSHGVSEDDVPF